MSVLQAPPSFGGKLRTQAYYDAVNQILGVLLPYSTLRTCAQHLNAQGFTTPAGNPWTRERVSTYLKMNRIKPTTN
jgi:hypothetical protein